MLHRLGLAAAAPALGLPTVLTAQQPAPATPPLARSVGPHRGGSWDVFASVGGTYVDRQLIAKTGVSQLGWGGVLGVGYNLTTSWSLSVGSGWWTTGNPRLLQPSVSIAWTPDLDRATSPFVSVGPGWDRVSYSGGHLTSSFAASDHQQSHGSRPRGRPPDRDQTPGVVRTAPVG